MNPPPPPPPPAAGGSETPLTVGSSVTLALALIPALFALVFHAGAAYMSYQRNQSFGWAILHFFLAVFYYPYYAFTQPSAASPLPESSMFSPTVQSAGRKIARFLKTKKH